MRIARFLLGFLVLWLDAGGAFTNRIYVANEFSDDVTVIDSATNTPTYTVDGISQSKAITRQVFASPPTVCG